MASDALQSSTLFCCHDDRQTPTLFLGAASEEERGQGEAGMELFGRSQLLQAAVNGPFGAAFQTAFELIEASLRYRPPPFLLLAAYVPYVGYWGVCLRACVVAGWLLSDTIPSFFPHTHLSRLCAPEDRRIFFAAVIHALFGKERAPGSSDLIKVRRAV